MGNKKKSDGVLDGFDVAIAVKFGTDDNGNKTLRSMFVARDGRTWGGAEFRELTGSARFTLIHDVIANAVSRGCFTEADAKELENVER